MGPSFVRNRTAAAVPCRCRLPRSDPRRHAPAARQLVGFLGSLETAGLFANIAKQHPAGAKAHINFAGFFGPTKVVPLLQSFTRRVFPHRVKKRDKRRVFPHPVKKRDNLSRNRPALCPTIGQICVSNRDRVTRTAPASPFAGNLHPSSPRGCTSPPGASACGRRCGRPASARARRVGHRSGRRRRPAGQRNSW